jgi:hypothetical protein
MFSMFTQNIAGCLTPFNSAAMRLFLSLAGGHQVLMSAIIFKMGALSLPARGAPANYH